MMDLAQKIVEFLTKKAVKRMEQEPIFLKLLKFLGITKLENNFESIYIHALAEFSSKPPEETIPEETVKLFASNEVENAFCEYYKNNTKDPVEMANALYETLHRSPVPTYLEEVYPSAEAFITDVIKFSESFKKFAEQTINPEILKHFNKLNHKMLEIWEFQEKKSFKYQLEMYLEKLVNDFNKEFLDKNYYIDLNGETRKYQERNVEVFDDAYTTKAERAENLEIKYDVIPHEPLDSCIYEWLKEEGQNLLVIMGEYGTGKTTFCKHMAHQMAESFLNGQAPDDTADKGDVKSLVQEPRKWIPLYFPLRDFEKNFDSFIVYGFNKEGITDINYADFLDRMKKGEFVLILDGFDEMTQKIDAEEKRRNFDKIRRVLLSCPNCKVILTIREEYFRSRAEFHTVFKNDENSNYRFVYLRTFEDDQISQFLASHTDKPEFYLSQIIKTFDLHDLAKRAVLLQLIVDYLPKLIDESNEETQRIRASDLYGRCIDDELERTANKLVHIIPGKYRLKILRDLAVWMFSNDVLSIDVRDLPKQLNFKQYFKTSNDWEFERYLNEFLTFTFLIQDRDYLFRISHKSFRDYLTAQALKAEIDSGIVKNFSKKKTPKEVNCFILEQGVDKEKLLELVLETRKRSEESQWSGTNAVNLLLELDRHILKGENLSSCRLTHVDFRECGLTGTNFQEANLGHCYFDKSILSAKLDNVNVEHSSLDLSFGQFTDFTPLLKLKQLSSLSLAVNQLTSVTFLKELKELIKLGLSDNRITDITPLKELRKLKILYMSKNRIEDFTPLMELKQLEELYLYYNRIDESEKQKLREALPDCSIYG
jgi:hypothetical protein